MKGKDFWERYCSTYERPFHEQLEQSRTRNRDYFEKWRKTDLAKMLCPSGVANFKDVPITAYADYPMLADFRASISEARIKTPRQKGELSKSYYERIGTSIGQSLERYMVEPYHLCIRTSGTTGQEKWVLNGETFWNNLVLGVITTAIVACSDGWGETKLEEGDKGLNINAPIPMLSGWSAWASQRHLQLVPPIEVTDNLNDMKQVFSLVLKFIRKGERLSLGGGIGSLFYMLCKHFTAPEDFYREYYNSMTFGLQKTLLGLTILKSKIEGKSDKKITDFIPLKGVLLAGMESRLYIKFFREEFGLEPLNNYGSTEGGIIMRGDPDRKTDLLPDLRNNYLEFKTDTGEIKDLDELKKGEVYDLIVSPLGSILYRYDMGDLLKVIDFRDDGMPVFAFEGRQQMRLRLYNFEVSSDVIVDSLARAGLRSSDKWAVTKGLREKEHLLFIMEKEWPYSEEEAQRIIFQCLLEAEKQVAHRYHTITDLVSELRIKDPSEIVKVEYVRKGAFTKYALHKAQRGAPIGQYKPPTFIPPEKSDVVEELRRV